MIQVHSGKRGKYNNAATGAFFPLHPEKYKGTAKPKYKSSLELRMMQYLDKNANVVSWTYETKSIKYIDKSENPPKARRYFIDFIADIKSGPCIKKVWIEVKPYCESHPPSAKASNEAKLLWIKNSCKWNAATLLAKSQGCEFHVITEKQLN